MFARKKGKGSEWLCHIYSSLSQLIDLIQDKEEKRSMSTDR